MLNKGLSFVPSTNVNEFDIQVDLYKFFRNVRLREFFDKPIPLVQLNDTPPDTSTAVTLVGTGIFPEQTSQASVFRNKSFFVPPDK